MNIETFYVTGNHSKPLPAIDSVNPTQSFILLFGASSYLQQPQIFKQIAQTYPGIPMVGCSTAGEIICSQVTDDTIVASLIQFDKTTIKVVSSPVSASSQSYEAGEAIAKQLIAPNLRGVFILSDGLQVNGSELVRGLNSAIPDAVPITGGLAGDGDRFQQTWTLKDGIPQSGFVTAVGFYGDAINFGHGSKGGWDIFGPQRRVSKSKGSTLYELDGKPALQLYKEYLGEQAAGLPATGLLFPLALRKDPTDTKKLVRTILAVDEENQSLTFAGDIPEGHFVQMMQANFDRLITGASDAALLTKHTDECRTPALAIAISCVGRRLILGERTEEEIESTLEIFPDGTHQIGFYSYGEISPYVDGTCNLHNQTMTLTTISES